jgi:hypothetical protein
MKWNCKSAREGYKTVEGVHEMSTIHPKNKKFVSSKSKNMSLKGVRNTKTQDAGEQCCGNTPCKPDASWITGRIRTAAGPIAQVSVKIDSADRFDTVKVRFGINRMHYTVDPDIYAVGNPGPDSPVLVTANYKLTFDTVRKNLSGLDAWLAVLDTKGVNVWCAAGKGTFGTNELIRQISKTGLAQIVNHRTLILPQLGATGVSAHEVAKKTGFRVVYGPVKASDIKGFLAAGNLATPEMRQVRFPLADRLVLTPVEFVNALKPSLLAAGILFLINLVLPNPFGLTDVYAYLGALFAGCILTPALLPWIPGKAFAWKGFLLGLLWAGAFNWTHGFPGMPDYGWFRAIGYFLALPAVSGFFAMNFTGCSTFTSLAGVRKEMRIAVPLLLAFFIAGVILLLLNGLGIL